MSKLLKSKFFYGVAIVAILFVGVAAVSSAPATVDAQTCTISSTLRVGSAGAEVSCLQTLIGATVDGKFGPMTQAAVMAYQASHGLVADGVVGPNTRASLMASGSVAGTYPAGCTSATGYSTTTGMPCTTTSVLPAGCTSTTGYSVTTGMPCAGGATLPAGCTSTAGYSPTTGEKCDGGATSTPSGPLMGGAGSIDSFDEISGISSEEVGEGEDDVVVAGIEIENSDGSDIELSAVRLDFSTQPGNNDLDEFITEVAIMLDGEVFARVDADEFHDDNNWTRTVSLSSGAIIRADKTAELTVAVSGVNNVDTDDAGDDWGLDFISVRYVDAQGAVITDNTDTNEFLFDVVAFANSANIEFKITSGDDDINDARAINLDADDDTDNVALFSFNVEIKGSSDVELKGLQLLAALTGTANTLNDMFSELRLEIDGEEVDSVNAPAHATDLVFDDIDTWLEAGDKYEFVLYGDFNDLQAGELVAGDTVSFLINEAQTNDADFDAEDEEGDDLVDADITGSSVGEAHGVFDVGIFAEFVSSSATATPSGLANIDDLGTFKIVFDVTAFDSDIYVDATAIADEEGGATYQDIVVDNVTATGVIDCSTCTFNAADGGTFKVSEGTTKRFTVTMSGRGDGVFAKAALEGILYAVTPVDGTTEYTFNMDEFETENVFLNDNGDA